MSRYPHWTEKEIAELKSYIKEGLNYDECAELMGRTYASISKYCQKHGITYKKFHGPEEEEREEKMKEVLDQAFSESMKRLTSTTPVPMKEKTLNDLSPRDIIKHLYDLGYRIEEGKLVCYQRHIVNTKDIINN